MQLHRGGRFRAWLGHRLGGDAEVGGRVGRRILHAAGAFTLLYYLFPPHLLGITPNWTIPLAALVAVLTLDGLRLSGRIDVPETRPYERIRLASYSYFGIAIVLSLLLFPEPIAVATILGTAFVDPLIGELRRSATLRAMYPLVPFAAYFGLATVALAEVGRFPLVMAGFLAALAGALAIAGEYPHWIYLDDDLVMTVLPGIVLWGLVLAWPGIH